MSQSVGVLDLTLEAGEDLSSNQYYAVYLSDEHEIKLCTTSHVDAIGILQNEPESGEAGSVRVVGTTKAMASESITAGERVIVGTDGKLDAVDTAGSSEQRVIGVALESASADGDIIEILLFQMSYGKYTS